MKERGFEYVDLGLPSGTMWATYNVGAIKPEDPGFLFQFGHIDGYTYGDEYNEFSESIETRSGKTYNTGDILDLDDDAAHVNMGGYWRMPTKIDLQELYDNTTHNTKTLNGVDGMMFTSNINGKQLFIPFTGYWYNGSFHDLLSNAYLWSSQVYSSYADFAYSPYCNSSGSAYVDINSRTFAFPIRGVFKK